MSVISKNRAVAVVGLGYVGLAVANAFGKAGHTIGFDIDKQRIEELNRGYDRTGEIPAGDFTGDILFTDSLEALAKADFYIIAVPTPIDTANQPDLTPLLRASETVGSVLKKGDIVVYESTVYPGVTEEVCAAVLETASQLSCGKDFGIGYSPERVNPGDKQHTFSMIKKIVAAGDATTLDVIAAVYGSVVSPGVYRAENIQVAEAAKVIENTQRDINIALMNELAIIFDRLGIDTKSVLAAAGTKWNFLKFEPGLVGGHCIGVDPYYLTHKAEKVGYIPQMILAGRRINDSMGSFIARQAVKEFIRAGHDFKDNRVTVLGLTFKENCADIRNSKVVDIIEELKQYQINVQVHDPLANPAAARETYGVELLPLDALQPADMIIAAVAHDAIRGLSPDQLLGLMKHNPVLIDVKSAFDPDAIGAAGIRLWRL